MNADWQEQGDVLIQGDKILEVGKDIKQKRGMRVIDATGLFVMPGGIDPHTHLAMPFMGQTACDDFYSGQIAALAGGTTFHIDFALPVDHDLVRGYAVWREKAKVAVMDYSFHMAITSWNETIAEQMKTLTQHHGINSYKFFMAYKNALMVNDEQLLEGLHHCLSLRALPQVHAENGDAVAWGQKKVFDSGITAPYGHSLSRPPLVEAEATARAIRLAELVGTPIYVVHVMSSEAAEEIAAARLRGARVIGETVTSAIELDETLLYNSNFTVAAQYVMSPPIRSSDHKIAIRKALTGDILQILGTDHAVFNSTQKAMGKNDFRKIPNGVNGIEERLHVAWEELVNTGRITPSEFVRITSTNAAKVFNIYPRKGTIAAGSDADIILFDSREMHTISASTHHSRMDTNVYEGKKIRGRVKTTISRGRVVWNDGVISVARGSGKYIPLPPYPGQHGRHDEAKLSKPYHSGATTASAMSEGVARPTHREGEL